MDLLLLADVFATGQQHEELVDVLVNRSGAATMRKLAERVAAQGRPEAFVDAVDKSFQLGNTMVLLPMIVPLAGCTL